MFQIDLNYDIFSLLFHSFYLYCHGGRACVLQQIQNDDNREGFSFNWINWMNEWASVTHNYVSPSSSTLRLASVDS